MISKPSVTLSIIPAAQLAGVADQKVLAIGQMTNAGTATAGSLVQNIGNDSSESTLFGANSHLATIIREFKKLNKRSRIDAIPVEDSGTGVAATASITFSGTASESRTYTVTVCSAKNWSVDVAVASGDTAADVAAAVEAAFTDLTDYAKAPFTADSTSGEASFEAVNAGTLGNSYDIKVEGTVAGLTYTLAAWSTGANDPVLTGIFDVISNIRYQTIIFPSNYDITAVQDLLDARFNVTNDVMDGVAIQVIVSTLADAITAVEDLNSQNLVVIPNNVVDEDAHVGAAIIEMPDVIAAQVAAIRALRFTADAPLSQFQTTVSSKDQFGGIAIASLPYFNTSLPLLTVPDPSEAFAVEDVAEMEASGLGSIGANRAYNGVIMGELVTTYLTDGAGNSDTSYKYLNTVDTASVVREFFYTNLKQRFAQSRLTDGDLIAGRDMANASSIRSFCNQLYDELADEALLQAGSAAKKDFDSNLIIEVSVSEGSVTIAMAPLLVGQLRLIIGTIQINFGS
jgi:phage tail sheath gpL-like